MKFLTINSEKDTASTLPPAIARQLVEATLDFVKQQRKAGKILEIYELVGCMRCIVISEFDSAEEAEQLFSAVPLGPFLNWETYALSNWDEFMKVQIESAKRAEQLFPAPPK